MFRKQVLGVSLQIRQELCTSCSKCVLKCRNGVLDMKFKGDVIGAAKVDNIDNCSGCRRCQRVCPTGAIDLIVL